MRINEDRILLGMIFTALTALILGSLAKTMTDHRIAIATERIATALERK